VEVDRFPEIKVRAYDRQGKRISKRYMDFLARVAQHELDHLDGKLIVDFEGTIYFPKDKKIFFERIFAKTP
jgi:peptide deformylase